MQSLEAGVPRLAVGAGFVAMVAASLWAPAQPELLVTGACNVAECGTLEDPQRWRAAWVVWIIGAVMAMGGTVTLVRRGPGTGWQCAALAGVTIVCLPVTAAVGAMVSLFSSVHGFATVMTMFAVLPLAAVLTGAVQSMATRDQRLPRPDIT
jgi:hypothetical protein